MKRVLVTRPVGQAEGLRQRLAEGGFVPVLLPMLTIAGVDPQESSPQAEHCRQCFDALSHYRRVIFISTNAVEHGLRWMRHTGGHLAADAVVYAIGPATAAALAAAGIEARQPEQANDSESLLALPSLAAVAGEPVLVVRGEGGLPRLADTLQARGARVAVAECYRRLRPLYSVDALQEALQPVPAAALVASGETLQNLAGYLRPFAGWAMMPVVVPGERVAQLAHELGFQTVWQARGAGDDALFQAFRSQQP